MLKISPGHDHNDYHIARKLGLPILNVMNKDGTLNDVAGLYRYLFFLFKILCDLFVSLIFLHVRLLLAIHIGSFLNPLKFSYL